MRLIRWKAIAALGAFVALLALLWALFADRIVRQTTEEAASESLGAEVDIGRFRILETQAAVEMGEFQLADPFDRGRNLIEFDSLRLKIAPVPLVDSKLVIEDATLTGIRFNVPRRTPAREYRRGLAQDVMSRVRDFTGQFNVPLLSLLPVDTIQAILGDPSQLRTVQAANAFKDRTDSGRASIERGYAGLRLEATLDSARALGDRLAQVNTRDLNAARAAVVDLRHGIDSLTKAKERVAALERNARAQIDSLNAGLRALDLARQQDYDFARSLLRLPSFSGPDLSRALFGTVSIDRFQQALYWTSLARKYAPPGLLPRQQPGPQRLRRSGTTVRFPLIEEFPAVLVKHAELALSAGGAQSRDVAFRMVAADLTSDPALTRRPMTFAGRGQVGTQAPIRVQLGGSLDHTTQRMRDSASATVQGIPLPDFHVPGLPFAALLTRGAVGFDFRLDGEQVDGNWSLSTTGIRWRADSGRTLNTKETLVARVLDGVTDLDVRARLGGTISAPTLAISSNLGDVLAGRMRAILGEEAAKAEAKLRAQVDAETAPRIAEAKARVAELQTQVDQRVTDAQARIDAQKKVLQDRLAAIRLPGGLSF